MKSEIMFIILLKFSENPARAPELMAGHKAWLDQGFADGVFLMAGSIQPGLGGTVIARGETQDAIEARVQGDPFVRENVVAAEVLTIDPARVDDRLAFLKD